MATSVLQLQPEEQTLRKLTIAEYHKLVEAGVLHPKERVELLDGLLVQMAPIGPRHQAIVDQLTEEFSAQNKGRYKRVFFSDLTREPLQYLIRSHLAFHL